MITEIISLCIASYFVNGCASKKEKEKEKEREECALEMHADYLRPIYQECIKGKSEEECGKELRRIMKKDKETRQHSRKICDCIYESPEFVPYYANIYLDNSEIALECLKNNPRH
jgi:hypothetical protein